MGGCNSPFHSTYNIQHKKIKKNFQPWFYRIWILIAHLNPDEEVRSINTERNSTEACLTETEVPCKVLNFSLKLCVIILYSDR